MRLHRAWGGTGFCPNCGASISFDAEDLSLKDGEPAVTCCNCETTVPLSGMGYGAGRMCQVPPFVLGTLRMRKGGHDA